MAEILSKVEKYTGFLSGSVTVSGVSVSIGSAVLALGFLLGLIFIILEATRQKDNPNVYIGAVIMALLGGTAGARLYAAFLGGEFSAGADWKAICDFRGGMAVFGGIFGGMLLVWIYSLIARRSFGQLADTVGMGLLIAQIFGCFCYINREPLFFYEALWCLVMFLLFLILLRRKCYQGEVFLTYLVGFSAERVVFELFRKEKVCFSGTDLPVTMVAAAVLFALSLTMAITRGVMARRRRALSRKRKEARYEERVHAEAGALKAGALESETLDPEASESGTPKKKSSESDQ